jgi:hypothetical protein
MGFFGDVEAIAEEDEVELRGFGLARHLKVVAEVDRTIGDGLWMAPRTHVAARAGQKGPDSHLFAGSRLHDWGVLSHPNRSAEERRLRVTRTLEGLRLLGT